MEKKTTQRIIGILVVVALVIILLPLLFSKNNLAIQSASVKAPPFPEQQSQDNNVAQLDGAQQPIPAMAADAQANAVPADTSNSPAVGSEEHQQDTSSQQDTATPQTSALQQNADGQSNNAMPQDPSAQQPDMQQIAQQLSPDAQASAQDPLTPDAAQISNAAATPDQVSVPAPDMASNSIEITPEVASQLNPGSVDVPKAEAATGAQNASATPAAASAATKVATAEATAQATAAANVIPVTATPTVKAKHVKTASLSHASLKTTAWVVQLGSFKDKNNARHLADKLRAAGYKAFMHEVHSSKGGVQTRVYIGPETKQASAAKVSGKLASQMNIQGFIVKYKPLEL